MNQSLRVPLFRIGSQRQIVFSLIIVTALAAFELFNFGTTLFAFSDLLGNLSIIGIRWAAILAFAFCAIDFAGIARLFSPFQKSPQNRETWYLFSAWLLAASMNAVLTWWGVSLALINHETLGNDLVDRRTLLTTVPVFVAILIWLIRVLIIGTFTTTGSQMFSGYENPPAHSQARPYTTVRNTSSQIPMRAVVQSRSHDAHPVAASSNGNGASPRYHPAPKNPGEM